MEKKPVFPTLRPGIPSFRSSQLVARSTSLIQPKAVPSGGSRPQAHSGVNGVIQAYMPGGIRVLQARMAAQTAIQRTTKPGNPNSAKSPAQRNNTGAVNRPAAIQPKAHDNVDAFQVNLRPKNGGLQIPDQVRSKMETALGMDFSDVRIHVGPEASSIGALAYTWGTNIHFAPGQYNPHSLQGQKILGHELWHVVQQKSGRVSNPFGNGVAVVQDHALEAEADRMALKAALTPVAQRAR